MGLMTSKSKMNQLLLAAGNGDEVTVKHLISKRVYLNGENRYGNQALHLAAKYGRHEVVVLLIDVGNVNINSKGYLKQTSLHYAVRYCHLSIVECLVTRKAKCNKRDGSGDTPLHTAFKYFTRKCCYQSSKSECKHLCRLNECREISEFYEVISIFMKEKCVFLAVAIYLMKYGTANIEMKNKAGETAISCLPAEVVEPFLTSYFAYILK